MKISSARFHRILSMACGVLWLVVPDTVADEARFFRIVGPTATIIIAFTPDGYVTWTNAQVGTNYEVQIARSLGAATNWVDYIQIPASNNVVTHRLYDPNPPSGTVYIPAGSFTMGNCMAQIEGDPPEGPLHTVYVSAFYLERHEVTKAFWDEVRSWSGSNAYSYENAGSGKAATHPVVNVSWRDCVKWCNARSQKDGLIPCYYNEAELTTIYKTGTGTPYPNWDANGYRLPTEAEWEKAARGGVGGHRFPWINTDDISHNEANYCASIYYPYNLSYPAADNPKFLDGAYPNTSPVGYFAANGYGVYDTVGNVAEWCWDWRSGGYYSVSPGTDPRGPATGSYRIVRGGGWNNYAGDCRTAHRDYFPPGITGFSIGFRCALPTGKP